MRRALPRLAHARHHARPCPRRRWLPRTPRAPAGRCRHRRFRRRSPRPARRGRARRAGRGPGAPPQRSRRCRPPGGSRRCRGRRPAAAPTPPGSRRSTAARWWAARGRCAGARRRRRSRPCPARVRAAAPAHIQADLVDAFPRGELEREVVGAVRCDRDCAAMRRGTLQQGRSRPATRYSTHQREGLRELARLVHLRDDVAAADSSPSANSWGMVGHSRARRAPGGCAGRAARRRPRTARRAPAAWRPCAPRSRTRAPRGCPS